MPVISGVFETPHSVLQHKPGPLAGGGIVGADGRWRDIYGHSLAQTVTAELMDVCKGARAEASSHLFKSSAQRTREDKPGPWLPILNPHHYVALGTCLLSPSPGLSS